MVEEPFKLLIVDSVTANMRIDYSGRGELAERQQKLGQLMAKLRKVPDSTPWPPSYPVSILERHCQKLPVVPLQN